MLFPELSTYMSVPISDRFLYSKHTRTAVLTQICFFNLWLFSCFEFIYLVLNDCNEWNAYMLLVLICLINIWILNLEFFSRCHQCNDEANIFFGRLYLYMQHVNALTYIRSYLGFNNNDHFFLKRVSHCFTGFF